MQQVLQGAFALEPLQARRRCTTTLAMAASSPAPNRSVPITFTCGGKPMRCAPNTHSGNVVAWQATKFVITKSSSDRTNANRNPARIAGAINGSVTGHHGPRRERMHASSDSMSPARSRPRGPRTTRPKPRSPGSASFYVDPDHGLRVEPDGEVHRSPVLPPADERRPLRVQAEVRKPLEEQPDRHTHLDHCQVESNAEVASKTEPRVLAPRPEQVELVGGWPEDFLIAIRRRHEEPDVVSSRDLDVGDHGTWPRDPLLRADRVEPPEPLVDRPLDQPCGRCRRAGPAGGRRGAPVALPDRHADADRGARCRDRRRRDPERRQRRAPRVFGESR